MADRKIRQDDSILMHIHNPADGPVSPKEGQRNVLVTSALPYVNNVPHSGNIIGSTSSADVFARYNRIQNIPTLFVCGTDEYGTATETKALEEGVTPMELCTKFNKLHTEVYKWFQIGFDQWGRTSDPAQTEVTQDIYKHIHDNGYFESETSEQTYCEDDKLFLADRFVEGECPNCGYDDARGDQCDKCALTFSSPTELKNPRCKRNKNHKVSVRPSTHACIRSNAIQPKLEKWLQEQRVKGKWASNVVITDKGEIVEPRMSGEGLRPSAVTRDLNWGVAVPKVGDPEADEKLANKVIYVWFDAPIGYISMTKSYTDEWQKWWMNPDNVELFQFMGKDNVYFHTVLFPSMSIADGRNWTKLHNISSTQYSNYEDTKFSKSRNIGVFGTQAAEIGQPPSVWRYYLISNRPETSDSAFQWSKFISAVNSESLANLGNFVNRVIKFVNAKFDSVVPGPSDTKGGEVPETPRDSSEGAKIDAEFYKDINAKLQEYKEAMDATKSRNGLFSAMSSSARGNQYLQDSGLDNALLAENPERCGEVCLNAINLIYASTAVFHPFMPETSEDILKQLNAPARTLPLKFSIDILPGHKLGKAAHSFQRIDNTDGKAELKWKRQFGGVDAAAADGADAATDKQAKTPKAEDHKGNWAKANEAKKKKAEAAAAAAAAKSPEERESESKLEAQNSLVKNIRTGKAEGDAAKEGAAAKALKAQSQELRKKLKEAKI